MKIRLLKIILSWVAAIYMFLVALNNLTDPDSNLQYVHGVFSMQDVFSGDTNRWRAIQTPWLQWAGYSIIIGLELIIAIILWKGSFAMLRNRHAENQQFEAGKTLVSLGLGLGVFLWFFFFVTIGGEWFLMWQSDKWNGQSTAFSLTSIFLLLLIFINQNEPTKS